MTFLGNAEIFRERPKKRSFKNFGKNLAPPVSEVLDPLVGTIIVQNVSCFFVVARILAY